MVSKLLHCFVNKWFFAAYFASGVLYFIFALYTIPCLTVRKLSFITLALMTGSDPYTFLEIIGVNLSSWTLAWVLHIGSWLLIPAIIGVLVNDAAQDIKEQQRLQLVMRDYLIEVGIKPDKVPIVFDDLQSAFDEIVTEYKKGVKEETNGSDRST